MPIACWILSLLLTLDIIHTYILWYQFDAISHVTQHKYQIQVKYLYIMDQILRVAM